MASVPIIAPKIAPQELNVRPNQAHQVNAAPLARGVQSVGNALQQVSNDNDAFSKERRAAEEKEIGFQRVRAAQDAYIGGSNALHQEWTEVAKLRGRDAEKQSTVRMQAAFGAQLKTIDEIQDIQVQNAARSNLMRVHEGLMGQARKHSATGRIDAINDTFNAESSTKIDTIVAAPYNEENWNQLDKSLEYMAGQTGMLVGEKKDKMKALRNLAAQKVIDKMLAEGSFDEAEQWIGSGDNRHKVTDRKATLDRINSASDAFDVREKREIIERDDERVDKLFEVKQEYGEAVFLAAIDKSIDSIEDVSRRSKLRSIASTIRGTVRTAQKEMDVDLQRQTMIILGNTLRTVDDLKAAGITDIDLQNERLAVVAKNDAARGSGRLEDAEKDRQASEDLVAKQAISLAFLGGDKTAITSSNPTLMNASPAIKKWASDLHSGNSIELAGMIDLQQKKEAKAKAVMSNDLDSIHKAINILRNPDIKSESDLINHPEYYTLTSGISTDMMPYMKAAAEYHKIRLQPDPPTWATAGELYFPSGNKDPNKTSTYMDGIINHVVKKKGFFNNKDLTGWEKDVLRGEMYTAFVNHFTKLEREGKPAGAEEVKKYFDVVYGDKNLIVLEDVTRDRFTADLATIEADDKAKKAIDAVLNKKIQTSPTSIFNPQGNK